MELQDIVNRYAAAIEDIDSSVDLGRANPRTGEIYLPGAKSLVESDLVKVVDEWWSKSFPHEMPALPHSRTGVNYPQLPRTKCDHVLPREDLSGYAWAIEVKNITLIGNNGKRNDFSVAKTLSPFLKDRSLLHDVVRLRAYELADRHAVIGYSYTYNEDTCNQADALHPQHKNTIANIREVVQQNGGELSVMPLLDFADGILRMRGLSAGSYCTAKFNAWAHPCGGQGIVFGWEVRRPEKEALFDPRHPW